jgi:isopentenyl-diphosphate Delta-isomerase
MKPLVTEVNEKDEVIGARPKIDFLNSDLIHRSSHLLIFNKKGELLIQKRVSTKNLYPNLHTFAVSGTVDENETYEQTIEREMQEEVGIKVKYKVLFKFHSFDPTDKAFKTLYYAFHEGPFVKEEREIAELKWISLEDLKEDLDLNTEKYTPPFKKGMELYFKKFETTVLNH